MVNRVGRQQAGLPILFERITGKNMVFDRNRRSEERW